MFICLCVYGVCDRFMNRPINHYNRQSPSLVCDKSQHPKCVSYEDLTYLIAQLDVRPMTTFDEIVHILKNQGYDWDPDFPPLFWKIDAMGIKEIDLTTTVTEMNIQLGETIMVSRIEVPDCEVSTMYLRLRF